MNKKQKVLGLIFMSIYLGFYILGFPGSHPFPIGSYFWWPLFGFWFAEGYVVYFAFKYFLIKKRDDE